MTADDFRAVAPAMENAQIERALALGQPTVRGATP